MSPTASTPATPSVSLAAWVETIISVLYWKVVSSKYPEARCWVRFWRPGYSRDGTGALVPFTLEPLDHGGGGVYFLRKTSAGWEIGWWKFVYYG